jgi:hypothetical protein
MMFSLDFLTESDLETVPWVFKSELELDISVQECWDIITDNLAYKVWHPEVTDIKNIGPALGKGNSRTIVLRHWFFSLLLAGPPTITESFDVWEDSDSDMKRRQCWFSSSSRPKFMTYKRAREEFKVEAISENKCKFTRTVGMDPAFMTRYGLGCLVYPILRKLFTVECPERLADAIQNKVLPLQK